MKGYGFKSLNVCIFSFEYAHTHIVCVITIYSHLLLRDAQYLASNQNPWCIFGDCFIDPLIFFKNRQTYRTLTSHHTLEKYW